MRSAALYPGQPWIADRQSSETADAPKAAPTRPPAIAATVSASGRRAPRSRATSASDQHRNAGGSSPGTENGVRTIAHHAACSASTTQPFLLKSHGRSLSAATSRAAQTPRGPARQVLKPYPGVEFAGQDGVPDGQRPEHAGLAGRPVEVGERADGHRRLRQPTRIIEVREGDRRGSHQRAVAAVCRSARADRPTPPARRRPRRRCRRRAPGRAPGSSGCPHRARCATTPPSGPRSDPGRRCSAGRRRSRRPRRSRSPSRCRRSTRLAPSCTRRRRASSPARRRAAAARTRSRPERIASGGREQHAAGPIALRGSQSHGPILEQFCSKCQPAQSLGRPNRKSTALISNRYPATLGPPASCRWRGRQGVRARHRRRTDRLGGRRRRDQLELGLLDVLGDQVGAR